MTQKYENLGKPPCTPKMQEWRKEFEACSIKEIPGEYKYNEWQADRRTVDDYRKSFEFEGEDRPIKICAMAFPREIMNRLKCIKEEKEKKEANGSSILVGLEEKNTEWFYGNITKKE